MNAVGDTNYTDLTKIKKNNVSDIKLCHLNRNEYLSALKGAWNIFSYLCCCCKKTPSFQREPISEYSHMFWSSTSFICYPR